MSAQHTPGRWLPADPARAAECERAFQVGGPRVYGLDEDGRMLPSSMGAERAVRCSFPGTSVYARRKVDGRYVWMCAAIVKATGGAA